MNAMVKRIVDNQAKLFYKKRGPVLYGWCDLEDIKQVLYERLTKAKLLDSLEHTLIFVVIRRALSDFSRVYLFGYSRDTKALECRMFTFEGTEIFNVSYHESYNTFLSMISLHKLINMLPASEQTIIKIICDSDTSREAAERLDVPEKNLPRIRGRIIDKLKSLAERGLYANVA